MNKEQFLEALEATSARFSWTVDYPVLGGCVGIRAVIDRLLPSKRWSWCPIEAVAHVRGDYSFSDVHRAAAGLGIAESDKFEIIDASDRVSFRPELRARILEAVGLGGDSDGRG